MDLPVPARCSRFPLELSELDPDEDCELELEALPDSLADSLPDSEPDSDEDSDPDSLSLLDEDSDPDSDRDSEPDPLSLRLEDLDLEADPDSLSLADAELEPDSFPITVSVSPDVPESMFDSVSELFPAFVVVVVLWYDAFWCDQIALISKSIPSGRSTIIFVAGLFWLSCLAMAHPRRIFARIVLMSLARRFWPP